MDLQVPEITGVNLVPWVIRSGGDGESRLLKQRDSRSRIERAKARGRRELMTIAGMKEVPG